MVGFGPPFFTKLFKEEAMNKRQRKKFTKRLFVYRYRHFKEALRLARLVVDEHRKRTDKPLEDWQKIQLWRHSVNIVRHPNVQTFTFRYLRFASTLAPMDKLPVKVPPKPSIMITNREEIKEYEPVSGPEET